VHNAATTLHYGGIGDQFARRGGTNEAQ